MGKPNPIRPRPISVEFYRRSDADTVFEYKYHPSGGIFVDRDFNLETENSRRLLGPILQAAKEQPELRYESQMDGPKLVIYGKRYGVEDIDKLPQKLSPFEVSTNQMKM